MLCEFSEVLRSLFFLFFFCITPLLALLAMSSLPTPGQNRLNFKSKCSFSFQRECFRRSRSPQWSDWQLLLALCYPPGRLYPVLQYFSGLDLSSTSVLTSSSLLQLLSRRENLFVFTFFFFLTWQWFDESLDPGTATCCNYHCTFRETEVWSLPSFLCWFSPRWCLDGALLDVDQGCWSQISPSCTRT